MYPQIVDLQQDRKLIKSNFNGYKLSLDTIATLKQDVVVTPLRARATEKQFSFLHTELFSMHNHLVQDQWNRTTSYFIDNTGSLIRCSYNENAGRPYPMTAVYKLDCSQMQLGDYNVSFQFISEKFCILCDGGNQVILLDTNDRYKSNSWQKVFTFVIASDLRGFILKDSRLDMIEGLNMISCCFQQVWQDDSKFSTKLFWVTIKENIEKDSWSYKQQDILYGTSSVYYCAFEPKAASLILSSSKEFQFESAKKKGDGSEYKSAKENDVIPAPYCWSQSDEDITIQFVKKENKEKKDYKILCTQNTILVKCVDTILLEGDLFGKIIPDITTWTLENDFLQVTLAKETCSTHWSFLIENSPKETTDVQNNTLQVDSRPIPNLEAQIEECDFPTNTLEDEFLIQRLNLSAKCVTHSILLGNNPPIFSSILHPGFPPAIVIRQDVDACIWSQQYNPLKPNEWKLKHEGNLHAFGYVQASKQEKKFIGCAPDLSYAIICESHRHVFIYKSNYNTAGLRNRGGSQVSVGKQHLVTLQDKGEVIGMSVDINIITLLTESCILYIQVNNS